MAACNGLMQTLGGMKGKRFLDDLTKRRTASGQLAVRVVPQTVWDHLLLDEVHITGAAASHDAIVWGPGAEGARNKAAGTPKLTKPITSELGAVCPTIVRPGTWSGADLRFQAEHIVTQKLHNSGFNCVACQMLILPGDWPQ